METAGIARIEDGSVGLIDDLFLSQHLRRRVAQLPMALDGAPPSPDSLKSLAASAGTPSMVFARVPAAAVLTVRLLERVGFRIADTCLTFERGRLASDVAVPAGVRPARPDDEIGVVALARTSLRMSRFHRDPEIGPALGDAVKAAWAANFFRGERGDAMVVVERSRAGSTGSCWRCVPGTARWSSTWSPWTSRRAGAASRPP
jgi:hypothetical protein